MRKNYYLLFMFVVSCQFLEAQVSVENKATSKNYSLSSSVVNSQVIDTKFEIPITETGYYLVILEADGVVPSASLNNCQLNTYWRNGHVYVFNKNTGMSPAAGEYKWIMFTSGNNCTGGYTVPRSPSRSYTAYLQAGHKLGVKAASEKVGTMPVQPWSYSGKVIVVRLN